MEQKAFRRKLWVVFGMEQYLRRMWEHFTVKRVLAKAVLSDAERERQEGKQGNWQKDSPFKQELEPVKRSSDLSFNGLLMRRAYCAGNWESYKEEFQKDGKLSVWASIKVTECYENVQYVEKGRPSIAQDILGKKYGFSEENHRTHWWSGRCHFVVRVLSLSLLSAGG